ncbi:MAG: endonuclease/exonuclease/phosphatase family protein [Gemmatimonadaceae bacterium]|nr:endonuclease/exonuclease/phosphatase family protein [Chitinophagaceae bacterium]
MARFVRKVTRNIFIAAHIVTVLIFAAACCTSFLHPSKYWFIAILGIGFPFLVAALVFFLFFWWFFKSKWAFLSLAAIILGWFQISVLFAFHPFASKSDKKEEGSLRVMQWNISRLDQMNKTRPGGSFRSQILETVRKHDADVLCFQEFLESNNARELEENIPYFVNELKYPYHYFARDHRRWDGVYEHGVIIFSRFPILDTLRLRYSGPDSLKASESLIHTDIDFRGQRVRIFTTHMQSLLFGGEDYYKLKSIATAEDSAVEKSKSIIKKFRRAYGLRSSQAELVRRELDSSPYPEILCGDFNDVPNSFCYFKVKGDRQDAFLREGFGLGRSFASLSPTLRIDYIFADKKFEVLQCRKFKLPYSDHYPIVADFLLSK